MGVTMDIKKVIIGMGRTINLGNFESARFDLAIEAETDALEDIKGMESIVSDNLEQMISRKLDSLIKNIKPKEDNIEDFI